MSNIISFGKHAGKSFEWLFFHVPWYVQWMCLHGIHRQRHNLTAEEGDYFEELFQRASALKGICRWCRARRITRLGITSLLAGGPDHIGFYCGECEYPEQGVPFFGAPSFFVEYDDIPKQMQRRVTKCIQQRYIGPGTLTQAKMEEFFSTDDFFVHATPGFFAQTPLVVASG